MVTWFAGLFYIVRLFIYDVEAKDKPEPERRILSEQFRSTASTNDCSNSTRSYGGGCGSSPSPSRSTYSDGCGGGGYSRSSC